MVCDEVTSLPTGGFKGVVGQDKAAPDASHSSSSSSSGGAGRGAPIEASALLVIPLPVGHARPADRAYTPVFDMAEVEEDNGHAEDSHDERVRGSIDLSGS